MKILVINPTLRNDSLDKQGRRELGRLGHADNVRYTVVDLPWGPSSVESEYDERMASPFVLDEVIKAERAGYDAVFISCTDDVALSAAREVARIPIVAPLEICMMIAATLGRRFSVLSVLENEASVFHRRAMEYGMEHRLASVRSIDVPVLDLESKRAEVANALYKQGKLCIATDGADTLILGCTDMAGMASELQRRLKVPVIDPVSVSIKYAQLLVSTGLSHSKLAYPFPPRKLRMLPHSERPSRRISRGQRQAKKLVSAAKHIHTS
jgi:allantoin racemase